MAQRTPISHVDTYEMPFSYSRTADDIVVDFVEGSGSEHEYQPNRKMEPKHRKKQVAPIQTTFYCWKLTKAAPKSKDKDAPSWKRAERVQMTLPSDELAAQVKKQCKARSLIEMYEALSTDQRQQVEVLVQEKRCEETNRYASWEIAAVHREIFNNLRTRVRETTFIRVILRREDKRRADSVSHASKASDTASNISDLNDLPTLRSKQVDTRGDRHVRSYRTDLNTPLQDRRTHEDVIEVISVPDGFQGPSSLTPPTPPPALSALPSRQNQAWQTEIPLQDIFQKGQNQISIPQYQPNLWRPQQPLTSHEDQQTQHPSHEQDALAYIAGMKHDAYAGMGSQHQDQQRQTLQSLQAPIYTVNSRPLVTQPVLQTQWQPELQRHQSYPQHSTPSGNQEQDYSIERQQPYLSTQRGGLDTFQAIVMQQPSEQLRRHQTDQLQTRSALPEPWSSEQNLPAPWNFEHSAHDISKEMPSSVEAHQIRHQTDYFGPRIDNPYEVAKPMFVTNTRLMSAGTPGVDANHYPGGHDNRRKSPYKDDLTPSDSNWPNYNPTDEQPDLSVPQPPPQQQVKSTNQSAERLRREDILFWRTQAQLSHSRSVSSLDDQSSTLASPEQSTPPTSISGARVPVNRRNTDRTTYDMPEQFGQQLAAHEFLRPNSNRQHEKPFPNRSQDDYKPQTHRRVSFEDQQPFERQGPNQSATYRHHQATQVQNAYQRPSAQEPPAPQTNYTPHYPLQQYKPQHQEPDNTSMLERLNERLDHMELRQAEGATRKAVEAAQKRREIERKEAYEQGLEDAMKWKQSRPSGFGQF